MLVLLPMGAEEKKLPKLARELTAIEVNRLTTTGFHAIGGVAGLHLRVVATGARTWILRVVVGNKRRDVGLGGFPTVSLAQARAKAREAREKIEDGFDPVVERQRAKSLLQAQQVNAITFQAAASAYMDAKSDEWKNPKHRAQWAATLETYAYPIIGKTHVKDVEQGHVLAVLEPIWKSKTETASRLRGRIENVLSWATTRGYRSGENPARWRGHLSQLLANPNKIAKVQHHPALPIDATPSFVEALKQHEGFSARALELLVFTASRSGEIRGMKWDEVDLNTALWTIPARRMKAEREHRVPLSSAALRLLKALPRTKETSLVFPAPKGGPLSDMSMTALMRRMNVPAVPHGLRSTFRDWAAERTNYPRDLAEMALAHSIGDKTEAAYRRGDMLERRRALMEAWASFASTRPTGSKKVVPIGKLAA